MGQIICGDALTELQRLPAESVHCCVTSPPYWGLRDYGHDGQLGLEQTPEEYVDKMVAVFGQVWRVLRDDGTLWLNLGDSYASSGLSGHQQLDVLGEKLGCGGGHKHSSKQCGRAPTPAGLKPKDLVGIPWGVAFALRAEGWYLRSEIIWSKPNPMPESVTDRPTKAHEYLFLLTKSQRYYYDAKAIREPHQTPLHAPGWSKDRVAAINTTAGHKPTQRDSDRVFGNPEGRNRRTVWTVATQPYKDAHFAVFPPKLIEPCIRAGCPADGTTLDPFFGAGTTGVVATSLGRDFIGIELNEEYVKMAEKRISQTQKPLFPL